MKTESKRRRSDGGGRDGGREASTVMVRIWKDGEVEDGMEGWE